MNSSPARSPTACTAATWAMLECGSALGKPPLKMQPACITSLSLATGTRCRIGKASKNRASFSFDPTAHPWHDLAKPVGCSESAGEWQEVATRVPRQQPSTGTVPCPSERLGGQRSTQPFPSQSWISTLHVQPGQLSCLLWYCMWRSGIEQDGVQFPSSSEARLGTWFNFMVGQ